MNATVCMHCPKWHFGQLTFRSILVKVMKKWSHRINESSYVLLGVAFHPSNFWKFGAIYPTWYDLTASKPGMVVRGWDMQLLMSSLIFLPDQGFYFGPSNKDCIFLDCANRTLSSWQVVKRSEWHRTSSTMGGLERQQELVSGMVSLNSGQVVEELDGLTSVWVKVEQLRQFEVMPLA